MQSHYFRCHLPSMIPPYLHCSYVLLQLPSLSTATCSLLCPPLPGSLTVSVLTRRLKPAGCGCCVGNSRWGCFPTSGLPRCSYRSSRAWRTTRRPLGSCGKPPPSLQHRRGVRHCLNCFGPHWKLLVAKKAGGFIYEEGENQIPVPEFLFKIHITPIRLLSVIEMSDQCIQ